MGVGLLDGVTFQSSEDSDEVYQIKSSTSLM